MRRVQMPSKLAIACLWPGLLQLWLRGSWVGLTVAVGFTALLNVMLLATFVYGQWVPRREQLAGAAALAVVWLVSWLTSRAELRRNNYALQGKELDDALLSEEDRVRLEEVAFRDQEREQLYIAAQRHYLQGDWVATERTLHQLLKQDARDAQSRLMLATLWRHQGRLSEAARQLDKLERLETAQPWQYEIHAERQLIGKMAGAADVPTKTTTTSPDEATAENPDEATPENTPTYRQAIDPEEETDGRLAA